ncbi:MAG: hypothetical protein ACYCYO_11955 [Bacilli bacterium]
MNQETKRMCRDVVEGCLNYIEQQQAQDGHWEEFFLRVGWGTSWPTAYIGNCLADTEHVFNSRTAIMMDRATDYLVQTWHFGGWGYNAEEPPDADSTSIALRFLRTRLVSSEVTTTVLEDSSKFLLDHLRDCGASTYRFKTIEDAQATGHPHFVKGDPQTLYRGWCAAHMSVGCSCLLALRNLSYQQAVSWGFDFARYLYTTLRNRGRMDDYWWAGTEYPTIVALDALECRTEIENSDLHALARRFESVQFLEPLNAMSITSELRVLLFASKYNDQFDRSVLQLYIRSLVSLQTPNGSFPPAALMSVPLPWVMPEDPAGNRGVVKDAHGLFTTATVAQMVSRVLREFEGVSQHA